MLEVLLGGALSIVGGFVAANIQSRQAQKIRMSEVVAERKVEMNRQAYVHMKKIQTIIDANSSLEKVRSYMVENEDWFFENRLFLPGLFPDKWFSILRASEQSLREQADGRGTPTSLTEDQEAVGKWAAQAIDIIYSEMGLRRIRVRRVDREPDAAKAPDSEN